jgi:hypothetical protein
MQDYLMSIGYTEKDSLEITLAFIGGGVDGVEKQMRKILLNSDNLIEKIKKDVTKFIEGVKDAK